jgi:hypothetical protein
VPHRSPPLLTFQAARREPKSASAAPGLRGSNTRAKERNRAGKTPWARECTTMLAHTPCDSRSAYFKRGGGPAPSLGEVVTARRPLQRPRLSCRYSGASTSLLRGSSAPRRCCSTAASAVASQLPLQRCFYSPFTWVKCSASLLFDGRFSGRVSAAASAVLLQSLRRGHRPPRVIRCATAASAVASQLPLQRCFCRLAFTSWASAARRRCCATAILSASPVQSLRQRTRATGLEPQD